MGSLHYPVDADKYCIIFIYLAGFIDKIIMMITNLIRKVRDVPVANWRWRGLYFFGKTAHKKIRDKFKLDYDYYSNIPLKERDEELERIISLKKSKVEFTKDIPYFPINEYWDYHGTKLMTHTWEPPSHIKRKGVIVFLHSLNGHTGTFGEFARQLAHDGYTMTGFDFVNFGQSDAPRRGCLDSFDGLVETAEQYVIKAKTRYPNQKIFLSGMSLGGAVAFNILIKHPNLVDGAIFLSPSIRQNKLHYPLLKKMTFLLSLVMPYQQLLRQTGRNGSKYELCTYSKNDPFLYHGRLYPKTVREILLAMGQIKKSYRHFRTPYLLIQSGSDKLVDPFACLDLQAECQSTDKTTVIIHDMWHAIWLDDHVHDVINIIREWLGERV